MIKGLVLYTNQNEFSSTLTQIPRREVTLFADTASWTKQGSKVFLAEGLVFFCSINDDQRSATIKFCIQIKMSSQALWHESQEGRWRCLQTHTQPASVERGPHLLPPVFPVTQPEIDSPPQKTLFLYGLDCVDLYISVQIPAKTCYHMASSAQK